MTEVTNNYKKQGTMAMCEVLDKVENRGIQKGIEQGIEQGTEHTLAGIIHRMRSKGYSVEEIADLTERSVEEIKEFLQGYLADQRQ